MNTRGPGDELDVMRAMFFIYLTSVIAGIVYFSIIGLSHH
jgi:hypothetical protein